VKRKVKFQEGGAVEESPRNRQLRETMEKFGREGRRVGLAERARQREAANQAARRAAAAERAAAQREVERLNALRDVEDFNRRVQRGQVDADTMRRMGGTELPSGRQDFTTSPEGTTRRGTATGREMVPFQEPGTPARPSASRALAEVATPRQMPLGSPRPRVGGNIATMGGALALEAAEPMVNYGREFAARRGAEADARRELNLMSMRARTADAEGGDIAADAERQRQEANRPAPAPAPRPAPARRAAPVAREISADRLNDLMMGAEPANAEERVAQMRMRQRQRELEDRGSAFKKGGMVKPKPVAKKAGGMIKAAPKKMMKGGMIAKPKVAVKSKAKPMPFKKGGVIKKGRK